MHHPTRADRKLTRATMSFRDVGPKQQRTLPQRAYPKVRAMEDPAASRHRNSKMNVVVLHGRVIHLDDSQTPDTREISSDSGESSERSMSIREQLSRKSTFRNLNTAVTHYQKLVSDLESVLKEAGHSPEAAWRARILMKSAQETDKSLYDELYQFEKTLQSKSSDTRTAQTSCMKLHRDFKRSHRALAMCIQIYRKQQKADLSTLGAVGWTDRNDDIENVNDSLHTVQQLYNELAELVIKQQEPIDEVQRTIEYAHQDVERANHALEGVFLCDTPCMEESAGYDRTINLENDDSVQDARCGDWFGTSLETLKDDLYGFSSNVLGSTETYYREKLAKNWD